VRQRPSFCSPNFSTELNKVKARSRSTSRCVKTELEESCGETAISIVPAPLEQRLRLWTVASSDAHPSQRGLRHQTFARCLWNGRPVGGAWRALACPGKAPPPSGPPFRTARLLGVPYVSFARVGPAPRAELKNAKRQIVPEREKNHAAWWHGVLSLFHEGIPR
jgi:hypothetical protein